MIGLESATVPWRPVVLVVHEHYRQPGGEDRVCEDEVALLERHGHRVVRFSRHNEEISESRPVQLFARTIWNAGAAAELEQLARRERASVVHFHNTFPLISPSAYRAAQKAGAAVVQTLHNYRLICPGSLLMRQGRPCEECVGRRVPWPGVVHACYRDSRSATAASAAMLATHRAIGTWNRHVDRFIALTHFSRDRFIAGGLPGSRIAVKPNFVAPDPGPGPGSTNGAPPHAVYVGRLSEEKGIRVLLDAARRLGSRLSLTIVGDGPLGSIVAEAARDLPGLVWKGRLAPDDVLHEMGTAAVLIVPSLWYENFPRVIVEGLARGTPVLASRLGALAEIVEERRTGSLFTPGDAGALAEEIDRWLGSPPDTLRQARAAARGEFERRYGADTNYVRLLEIYRQASFPSGETSGSTLRPAPVARGAR